MRFLSIIFLLFSSISYGSSAKDTTVTYYDISNTPCKKKTATVVKKVWKENDVWKAEQRLYPSNILQLTGSFLNEALTLEHGVLTSYYDNGYRKSEAYYSYGKKNGSFKRWSEDGTLVRAYNYLNDELSDTGYLYNSHGVIYKKQLITNKGTGTIWHFYSSGQLLSQVQVVDGKKFGPSIIYAENGEILGDVTYDHDSIVNSTCKHAKPDDKPCIMRYHPEIVGDNAAFSNYLEKNLKYPEYAQENGIMGVVEVQFEIDSLGNTNDLIIINSPHSSLSEEVIRLFKNAPVSLPAVIHNKPIAMIAVQSVTFNLQ